MDEDKRKLGGWSLSLLMPLVVLPLQESAVPDSIWPSLKATRCLRLDRLSASIIAGIVLFIKSIRPEPPFAVTMSSATSFYRAAIYHYSLLERVVSTLRPHLYEQRYFVAQRLHWCTLIEPYPWLGGLTLHLRCRDA